MGTRDDEWEFLLPWLDCLSVMQIEDEASARVRVGGDADEKFWLSIGLEREDVLQQHVDGERAALRQCREAVVLMHLLASVKYDLWYEWMVVQERMFLPAWFIREVHRVEFKYAFEFSEEHDVAFLEWGNSLEWLLGNSSYSDEFRRDFARVQKLLKQHGVVYSQLKPIPIMLRGILSHCDHPKMAIDRISRAVEKVQAVETAARQSGKQSFGGMGVLFRVTALEVELAGVQLTTPMFESIHTLLLHGIDITYLDLPSIGRDEHNDTAEGIEIVGRFMRTLLGLEPNAKGQLTRVHHIVMPMDYTCSPMFAPFCSALVNSKFLKILEFENDRGNPTHAPGFGPENKTRRHVLSWLAFALFSSASSSSVQTLVIDGDTLSPFDIAVIQSVMRSEDPLTMMCEHAHPSRRRRRRGQATHHVSSPPQDSKNCARTKVLVELNGMLEFRDGVNDISYFGLARGRPPVEVQMLQVIEHDEDDEPKLVLFVPGIGFVDVPIRGDDTKRREVPHTPEELSGAAKSASRDSLHLHSLILRNGRTVEGSTTAFYGLLRMLGARFRSLSIDFPGIDDAVLDHVFSMCPRLESFAVIGASISSMDAFMRAYDQYRLSLSSLDFEKLSVPEPSFRHFLSALLEPSTMAATLERLRFGRYWPYEFSKETMAVFRVVLEQCKTLTHSSHYVSVEQSRHSRKIVEQLHGGLIVGLSAAEKKRRLYALGGLQRCTQSNATSELSNSIKASILAFAAPRPLHRSVTWSSTIVAGRMPRFPF